MRNPISRFCNSGPGWCRWIALCGLLLQFALPAVGEDALRSASWSPPALGDVRRAAVQWLHTRTTDSSVHKQAEQLWPADATTGADVLDAVGATISLVEKPAVAILEYSRTGTVETPQPDAAWLAKEDVAPWVRNNMRLMLGRRLVQLHYFDDALEQFHGLTPQEVADPASLLFYRGVAHHRLLHKEEGLAAVDQLLERKNELPARYVALATLMEADLRQLKDETLDHISRRMEDIERRLDQGNSGKKVRDIEDGVVKSLDKLIKELEDKQAQSAGAASLQPSAPAQDSQIAEGKGPGLVTKKDIGRDTAWGDLPPKERQEALQEIGRDFPANYKDVIEQYFRELAELKSEGE